MQPPGRCTTQAHDRAVAHRIYDLATREPTEGRRTETEIAAPDP